MKTREQIVQEVVGDDDPTTFNLGGEVVKLIMLEYAKEVIDDILTRPNMIHIYKSQDSYWSVDEALYDYEMFDEYKRNLI